MNPLIQCAHVHTLIEGGAIIDSIQDENAINVDLNAETQI